LASLKRRMTMSYEFYKVLHFIGLYMVFGSLGAATILAMNAGSKNFPNRKLVAITHGLGMLVVLVSGFGLMARLAITQGPWPGWVFGLLLVWLILGFFTLLVYRKPAQGKLWWILLITLGTIAAYFARFKP
jgi:uncharacterized membrane protein SirB2